MPPTQWLFRAISDQSQGTHSPNMIAPGAAAGRSDYEPIIATQDMKQIITAALGWKKTSGNEIGFWTSSLLFAIQTALFKAQKKDKNDKCSETNVRILCINTKTARAMDGGVVHFDYMPRLKKEHGVEVRNKDGSLQDHSEIWVTMECFVPGSDTLAGRLEDLEDRGLYKLYPALEGSWRSHRPRLNVVVQDMRKFHFETERGLTKGHFTVAAKVSAGFRPLQGTTMDNVHTHILVPLLALQKRPCPDPALLPWLQQNTVAALDSKLYRSVEAEEGTLPEIAEANRIGAYFQGKKVSPSVLSSAASITGSADWQAWRAWRRASRDARREVREGGDSEGSAGRQKRRQSTEHGESSRGDRSREAWVPRAEYELRLARRNDERMIGARNGSFSRERKRGRDDFEGDEGDSHHEGGFRAKRPRRDFSDRRPRRY